MFPLLRFSAFRPLSIALALCVTLFGSSGCAHYRLGTQGTLSFHTLFVAPVENKTPLPQAQAPISSELREAFLRNGRIALVNSPEAADAILQVTLVGYERAVTTVRPGDTGLARKFDLTLTALVTLRDQRSGRVLFQDRPVRAVRQTFTDSGQQQSEYETLPLLAESLAQKVVHAALDVW